MRPFTYTAPASVDDALRQWTPGTAFLAGGTTLVDLMKLDVLTPEVLVDLNALPLRGVRWVEGELRVGALERMAAVARHPDVVAVCPAVAEALLCSASPQLRNMATLGGNLLQRTRCEYFRDVSAPCNKRAPGSGCSARSAPHRGHAILGTSEHCVATHPSDLAVALVAFGGRVLLRGPGPGWDRSGSRDLEHFYRLPGDRPDAEHRMEPGQLVTEVVVPDSRCARHSTYVKVRDRSSYEFALASAAVGLDVRDGTVRAARVAVGGVGTRPWRLPRVEAALVGHPPDLDRFTAAARFAADGAAPLPHNGFKVELMCRTIVRALLKLVPR
jgi:xanthine dehydrogenase YagS FAD-binding subunit